MRILLVNKFFYLRGGAEQANFRLQRALAEQGHELIQFSMHHERNQPSRWSSYFASSVDYERDRGGSRSVVAAVRLFNSPEVATKLRALIRDARPDVAILHNIYHQLGPSVVMTLDDLGIPTVMVLHDYKVVCPSYELVRERRACRSCSGGRFYHAAVHGCGGSRARGALLAAESYWQWRGLKTYERIARFVAPSHALIDIVHEMGFPYPVTMIRNVSPVAEQPVDPAGGTAIGFAGRLAEAKGVDSLLEIAGRAKRYQFRIAGDGPERGRLEERARVLDLRNVAFLGHLDQTALEAEMRSWRMTLVPSIWPENLPYAVLESFALGLPVIGSRLGGLVELLEGRGVLCPVGEADAFVAAIEALWDDAARSRELGARGRRFVADECASATVAAAWQDVLEATVAAAAVGISVAPREPTLGPGSEHGCAASTNGGN